MDILTIALLAAAALFGVPSVILATATPIAVRLLEVSASRNPVSPSM